MRLLSLRFLRGPSIHSMRPCVVARLDPEGLGNCDVAAAVAPWSRKLAAVTTAELVRLLTDELQVRAGGAIDEPGPAGRRRETSSELDVVCSYRSEVLVEHAIKSAVDAVHRLSRGESPDLDAVVTRLREVARQEAVPAPIATLIEEAERRGIPVIRLAGGQNRFQLGWGSRQTRIGATFRAGALDGVGRVPIASITGTNGKTTTTQLIAHGMRIAGRRVGATTTQGIYFGDRLVESGDCTGYWSARTVLESSQVDVAVLETARGGILKRGLAFDACDVGVVLNVTSDHLGLDGVETVDDLAEVKGLIARCATRAVVLNAEDPHCVRMADRLQPGCEPAFFALDPGHEVVATQLARGHLLSLFQDGWLVLRRGARCQRLIAVEQAPMTMGGYARYNVANALAAAAALELLGASLQTIRDALATFASDCRQNPLRSNRFEIGGVTVLLDYAHNVAACEALFAAARAMLPHPSSRLIGVITAPGDRRAEDLAAVGAACGAASDELIVYELNPRGRAPGANAAAILAGAQAAWPDRPMRAELDIRRAIALGLSRSRAGDWVVFTCAGTLDDFIAGVGLFDADSMAGIARRLALAARIG